MELLVAVIAGLIAALVLWLRKPHKKTSPGPWGLPLVGYFPFLTFQPHKKWKELTKRYGNVFSMRLGSQYFVVLNDFKTTKDVFSRDECFGRPPEFPFDMNKETVETGAFLRLPWKEQRRYCLHMLRNVGFGKTKTEEHMQDEIKELLEYFEQNVDIPFQFRPRFMASMANNIASIVFGKRLKYEDPTRKMLTQAVFQSSTQAAQTGVLVCFPWLKKCFDLFGKKSPTLDLRLYAMKAIEQHERTLDPNNVRDFIDGYLLEIRKRKNDPAFSKIVLQDMISAFFTAGSETVRQTLEWLVLAVASDHKAQSRIQAEIDEVCGHSRMPGWSDHTSMPYTEAFIMETMRWRTLLPVNLIRYTLSDTEVNGYFIPKNTRILSNTWAIHNDPTYWGPDAEQFRPERFLTEDGKDVKKFERFMPFSIGKRACPGESLARVEVFLYFASILQRFNLSMPEGKVADFEGVFTSTLDAKPQDVVVSRRH